MTAICPSCGVLLAPVPTRKTKCKCCGEPIFVKYTPDNRDKRLMNSAQAEAADAAWAVYHAQGRIDSVTQSFGWPDGLSDEAAKTRLLVVVHDVAAKLQDRKMAANNLCTRFSATAEERLGWAAMVKGLELAQYKADGVVDEIIIRTDEINCDRCSELKDRRLTVNQAIDEMPLPSQHCPRLIEGRGACRCWYRAVVPGWT